MGEDRPYSELELRRLAKQQQSPQFRAWLAAESDDLAQLITVVPGLGELDDPWTVDGLAAIEDAALARFPTLGEDVTDEEADYLALCARGIGYIVLRTMGVGKWVWVEIYPGYGIGPAIELPGHTFWFDPGRSIRIAVAGRKPGELHRELDRLVTWSAEAATRRMVL